MSQAGTKHNSPEESGHAKGEAFSMEALAAATAGFAASTADRGQGQEALSAATNHPDVSDNARQMQPQPQVQSMGYTGRGAAAAGRGGGGRGGRGTGQVHAALPTGPAGHGQHNHNPIVPTYNPHLHMPPHVVRSGMTPPRLHVPMHGQMPMPMHVPHHMASHPHVAPPPPPHLHMPSHHPAQAHVPMRPYERMSDGSFQPMPVGPGVNVAAARAAAAAVLTAQARW